ncbi:choline transporter [Peptoniphilus sp. AGMB00490]|uniref:Choline transporter n=1 Tax=Peptoniphilus faecalis TaxID=2731255 RepID=A0A848RIU7_9FIRM|nr:BCCT family transporter [Peptoniphilus faecalis]NMW85741.1 choline transporter [Peptoniphilus faecalis]
MDNNKKYTLNYKVFIPAMIILTIFLYTGIFHTDQFAKFLEYLLNKVAENFGGYINILSLVSLFLIIPFIFSKLGDVKIGGKDAVPEYSTFSWIAMSLTGGIGTGLLFWAMGEPIFHFMQPPLGLGIEPGSRDAGIFAVSQAMWNWSFVQYCMYTLCAIGFSIIVHNLKKPLAWSAYIEETIGKKSQILENVINFFLIFCLTGAVANSMGVGLMQIGAGLEAAIGIEQSPFIWLVIAVIIGIVFITSSLSGLAKGLQKIASTCVYLFIFLLIYVFIFGDTGFMMKITAESFGRIIDNFGTNTTLLNTMIPEDTWSRDWIIQYWASFIVYAPVMGMFLSRLAKGRTVREFTLVNVLAPSIFCMVWIGIFGGMTINLQQSGTLDVWAAVQEYGMQATAFQILGTLPLGKFLIFIFLISICFSFVTLADPMSTTIATIATKGLDVNDEAPRNIKILIGVIMCATSYSLVASGGIDSVRGLFNIIGLLVSIIMIFSFVGSFRITSNELKNINKKE